MEYMIEINNLGKCYGEEWVLKDINLKMKPGEIHGIIGRNGSGKTMLMKAVCGFITPTEGEVAVSGKIIGSQVDFAQSIGVIIETPYFLPYFSGYKNLKNLADIRKIIGKEEIYQAMTAVGLQPESKKRVGKYSLGMRQRLGIAQAVMENPDILVLDEPMNGLDEEGVQDIRKLLLELKEKGKTVILATHNRDDIRLICDNIYEMEKGRMVRQYSDMKEINFKEPLL